MSLSRFTYRRHERIHASACRWRRDSYQRGIRHTQLLERTVHGGRRRQAEEVREIEEERGGGRGKERTEVGQERIR